MKKVLLIAGFLSGLFLMAGHPNIKTLSAKKAVQTPMKHPNYVHIESSSLQPVLQKGVKKIPIITTTQGKAGDSGGTSEKNPSKYGTKDITVIDSFPAPKTWNNGLEWDGRYLYLVSKDTVNVLDPEYGSVDTSWVPPTGGRYLFGAAFVGDYLYISDFTDGFVWKMTKQGVKIDSFPGPGGINMRGITGDGNYLYIASTGGASGKDTLYKVDTLMNIVQQWYIGGIVGWPMDMVYVQRDGTIYIVDDISDNLKQVDISGSTPVLIATYSLPGNPESNLGEGIAFDGSDFWFNTYSGTLIYRLDGGYSISRVAIFQDREPWGGRGIKDILYANGIPFKVFTSSDMGNVDLSMYTKVIVSSVQPESLYQHIASNKTWWENWIGDGGVFQFDGAEYVGDDWSGLIMPGGFTGEHTYSDTVHITSSWHPLVSNPHAITDSSLQSWHYSTHGSLVNLPSDYYPVVWNDSTDKPATVIFRLGNGGVIATKQPLEWAWDNRDNSMLENVVLYWVNGVTPNVLMAISDGDQPGVRNALMSFPDIGNVDHMDLTYHTPTTKDLSLYDVIFTWTNFPPFDSSATGDTLAAFVDSGKWVLTCAFSWFTNGYHLGGNIMSLAYNPFYSPNGGNHFADANLGWYDGTHPIMNGVSAVTTYFRDSLVIVSGADSVARWNDGEWFIGTKAQASSDGGVIGFNASPGDTLYGYSWSGDMMLILHNAILWGVTTGIEDREPIIPDSPITILKNLPNPFTKVTTISYFIPEGGNVNFKVFNSAGQEITSITTFEKSGGVKHLTWNAVDTKGKHLSSGVYFYTIEWNGIIARGKATLLR